MNPEAWACAGATRPDGSYALPDAVRMPCRHKFDRQQFECWPCVEKCDLNCHGIGWTPAQDIKTWLEAGLALGIHHFEEIGRASCRERV